MGKGMSTILGMGALSLCPNLAWAHRQKQAHSTLEWNERSQTLEVIHILHLHDAEQALSALGLMKRPDLTQLKARAKLALYVQEKFTLATLAGEAIKLDIIGAETRSGRVYIYFETGPRARPEGLLIGHNLLHDVYPDQVNRINVTLGGELQSLSFGAGERPKKVLA